MKKIFLLLFAGVLSVTSCTETFAPDVNYGDQTYINDYTTLVDAVNDLNQSLSTRMDALNELLTKGLANIEVAIDENTGAIEILNATVNNGMTELNTTMLNGFTALTEQVKDNGTNIVTAIDENGRLLIAEIDETGNLISAQIKESADALIKVINDQTAAISERISALDAMLKAGLAEIKVAVDENTGAINVLEATVENGTATLNATMLNGFTTLNATIDANGTKIVTAVDSNGNILKLAIEANGTLISTAVTDLETALTTIITNLQTSMEEKLAALTTMIETVGGNLEAKLQAIDDAIATLTGQQKEDAELLRERLMQTLVVNSICAFEADAVYINPGMAEYVQNMYNSTDADVKEFYFNLVSKINNVTVPKISVKGVDYYYNNTNGRNVTEYDENGDEVTVWVQSDDKYVDYVAVNSQTIATESLTVSTDVPGRGVTGSNLLYRSRCVVSQYTHMYYVWLSSLNTTGETYYLANAGISTTSTGETAVKFIKVPEHVNVVFTFYTSGNHNLGMNAHKSDINGSALISPTMYFASNAETVTVPVSIFNTSDASYTLDCGFETVHENTGYTKQDYNDVIQ